MKPCAPFRELVPSGIPASGIWSILRRRPPCRPDPRGDRRQCKAHHPDCQAPRRLWPLAHEDDQLPGSLIAVARRHGRHGGGTGHRLCRLRSRHGPRPLAVGSPRTVVARRSRRLRPPAPRRALHTVRRTVRNLVRRRPVRAASIRLTVDHGDHAATPAERDGVQLGTPTIRWVGNEDGLASDPCWYTVDSTERSIYDGGRDSLPTGARYLPPECDVAIRHHWSWLDDDLATLKSRQLLDAIRKPARVCLSPAHDRHSPH